MTSRLVVFLFCWCITSINSLSSDPAFVTSRRHMIVSSSSSVIAGASCWIAGGERANAEAARAVGSGEVNCRADNTCLEKFELDGFVGWEWGGKDRCDALDPNCGANGQLRNTPLVGKPVPAVDAKDITAVAAIQIDIGRDESGVLKLGFYGNQCASQVKQMLQFLSDEGLVTEDASSQNSRIGRISTGVSLQRSGTVTNIAPSRAITLGVPSQSYSFARSRGRSKAGDDFVPQNRPQRLSVSSKVRPHDCAGLLSLNDKGLGYGGTGFENADECFESAFIVTADAMPSLDSSNVVIGQILDASSMAFLERLANLPTQRGIRGVLPGQTFGPPLPKVAIRQIQVSSVSTPSSAM